MKSTKMPKVIRKQSIGRQILKHWEFYLLLIPGILLTIMFKYIPMYGVQIAFRDYNAVQGFFDSPWVGWKWFIKFFDNYRSARLIQNTILLSLYSLLWSFPIPIFLSLIINQVRHKKFQRTVQTILYAPHFISVMILCGMLRIFLSPYGGLINVIAQALGAEGAVSYLDQANSFRTIYIASGIWQDAGWGMIIYLATLSSVDASLHEAAKVDGATAWQRMIHIDMPALAPIIVIQLIMSFGSLMSVGFDKAFLLQTELNKASSEIIATYVYEQGMLKAMYSFSTAVGLFNTIVNLVLLLVVNQICKKVSDISFV